MFKDLETYKATGLFSMSHIISFAICFLIVAICVYLSVGISKKETKTIFIFFAVSIFIMLLIEFVWNMAKGYRTPENIVPISFVLFFVVALILSCFEKKNISKIAKIFIAYFGIGFGTAMLVLTIPSITNYPIFHFKCLFQTTSVSVMLYCGIMMFVLKEVEFNFKSFKTALILLADILIDCLVLSLIFNSNFLYIISPNGLNFALLTNLYEFNAGLYSCCVFFCCFIPIILTQLVICVIKHLINKCK